MLYGKKSSQDYSDAQKEVYGEGEQSGEEEIKQVKFGTAEGVGSLMDQISRLNVFIIGFFIISGVMLYLVIPDMLTFLAKAGIETLLNFKWFFIALFVGLFFLFAWFMYMKYQLARKSMDAQTEIRKYEIKMEYAKFNTQAALDYKRATGKDAPEALMIGYSDLEKDYKDVEYQEDNKDVDKGDAQTNPKGNQEK